MSALLARISLNLRIIRSSYSVVHLRTYDLSHDKMHEKAGQTTCPFCTLLSGA